MADEPKAKEPLKTELKNETGRPSIAEEQYQIWLESMRPYLENASSLFYSIEQAGLISHQTTIYDKYRLKDWFAQKVDRYRAMPGELVNDAITSLVRNIRDKIKRGETLSREDQDMIKFYAEKHRSAQPFFVNRTETATVKPIDDVLDELEKAVENKNDVADEAAKQVVANQPPVQNQEQAGANSDVPAQPDTTQA